jgi:hypothetical protein
VNDEGTAAAFDYGFPPAAPQPVAGCPVCLAYMDAIRAARSRGDRSAATDESVLMRRHLTGAHA